MLGPNFYIAFGHSLVRELKQAPIPPAWVADWQGQPDRFLTVPSPVRIPLDADLPLSCHGSLDSPQWQYDEETLVETRLAHWLMSGCAASQMRVSASLDKTVPVPEPVLDSELGRPSRFIPMSYVAVGRGVPSGGGLYPWEIYLVWYGSPGLGAGVYHYDSARHSLAPQATDGGVTGPVGDLGVLVLTVMYWKNYFKYANAAVPLYGLDCGVLLSHLLRHGPGFGLRPRPSLAFVDSAVSSLIGLDHRDGMPFALIHLRNDAAEDSDTIPTFAPNVRPRGGELARRLFGRSVPVMEAFASFCECSPPELDALAAPRDRVKSGASDSDLPTRVSLPLIEAGRHISEQFATRIRWRSSGIGARSAQTLTGEVLALLCRHAVSVWDGFPSAALYPQLSLFLAAMQIEGMAPGVFRYDRPAQCLARLSSERSELLAGYLQASYHLKNIGFDKASAVFFVVADFESSLEAAGNRAIVAMNLLAGMTVEGLSAAAAASDLGSHALLGFDDERIEQLLRIDGRRNWVLIGIAIGALPTSTPVQIPLWT